jgi:hypothetical protein
MTLQRKNPLPDGRYWVDVFGDKRAPMAKWFKAFGPTGVLVRTNESFAGTGANARDWYLFEVAQKYPTVPVIWDVAQYGYPTIAGPEVKSSADTAQTPEVTQGVEGLLQSAGLEAGTTPQTGLLPWWVLPGAVVGGVVVAAVKWGPALLRRFLNPLGV